MKKLLILSALLITFGLAGCKNNHVVESESDIPTESDVDSESSELTEYDKTVYVCFYADYNRVDLSNPLVGFMWYPGELLPTDMIPDMSEIEGADGYTEFAGWSTHTLIDDLDDLWDFETDRVPNAVNSLDLFGIWFSEGEIA